MGGPLGQKSSSRRGGRRYADGSGPAYDVAVDLVDGTRSCSFIRRPETTLSTVSSAVTTYPEPPTSASEPPTLVRCCPKWSELDCLEVSRRMPTGPHPRPIPGVRAGQNGIVSGEDPAGAGRGSQPAAGGRRFRQVMVTRAVGPHHRSAELGSGSVEPDSSVPASFILETAAQIGHTPTGQTNPILGLYAAGIDWRPTVLKYWPPNGSLFSRG
jgi:hypothetical protein